MCMDVARGIVCHERSIEAITHGMIRGCFNSHEFTTLYALVGIDTTLPDTGFVLIRLIHLNCCFN